MDNIISSISGDGLTQQRLKRTPATCQTKYWNSYIEMQMSFHLLIFSLENINRRLKILRKNYEKKMVQNKCSTPWIRVDYN